MLVRRAFWAVVCVVALILVLQSSGNRDDSFALAARPGPSGASTGVGAGSAPITKNMGQWAEQVLYCTKIRGAVVWFCRDGIVYEFSHVTPTSESDEAGIPDLKHGPFTLTWDDAAAKPERQSVVVKSTFVGANIEAEVVGEGELAFKVNYFKGNKPERWHRNVPNYTAITYKGLYPGVDVRYAATSGALSVTETGPLDAKSVQPEFTHVLYDSNNPFGNTEAVTDLGRGLIRVQLPWGEIVEPSAAIKQITAVSGDRLAAEAAVNGSIIYSTYLGADGWEKGVGIAVDIAGSAYIAGVTSSITFPTIDPFQLDQGIEDNFVTKLSSDGSTPIYSTYLGGSSLEGQGTGEHETDICVDLDGNAYVAAYTYSSDFPTTDGAYQTDQGAADGFVTKIDPTGDLVYSTYLGGSDIDWIQAIAIDADGNAYVTGYTRSSDFPKESALQPVLASGTDPFVTKLNPTGTAPVYSTYAGGNSDEEWATGIAVDNAGSAYVTGGTRSTDFPTTPNALQETRLGSTDAFVLKFAADGGSLVYGTYLGSAVPGNAAFPRTASIGADIDVDADGNAYVIGETEAGDFPTLNPIQTDSRDIDVFVTKLNPSGSGLVYGTYLGGGETDRGYAIDVDQDGSAYITGATNWCPPQYAPYPLAGNYIPLPNDFNAVVTRLTPAGDALMYSTWLGPARGYAIATDGQGYAYVTGLTTSPNFPIESPYQANLIGGQDAFVTKLVTECVCDCHADPGNCDGFTNILDVSQIVNVAFRNGAPILDPSLTCPYQTTDVDCTGATDVIDVSRMVNVSFRNGNPAVEFCNPCP